MRILIVGEESRVNALKPNIKGKHKIDVLDLDDFVDMEEAGAYDLIIDLNADDTQQNFEHYAMMEDVPVVLSSVKMQLAEMAYTNGDAPWCKLAGINALPGFIGRPKLEVSLLNKEDKAIFDDIFNQLGLEYFLVEDRVGMVSPRIVLMIINEAFYTLQEGTATAEDIDESMKLGTNYPYGPFEWCDRIGIENVYETLEALYADTHDERYKICPLIKTKYLKSIL
jgi:3-hydroxybutyryl-CoA dehydrogenase